MAHLVRVQSVRYLDADGRRVAKGAPGARKVTEKSAKWYGVGIPGRPPRSRVPLATDKEAARRMLDALVVAAERGEARMIDRGATALPLSDHLEAFRADLAAGLAVGTARKRRTAPSDRQVALVVQRVRDVFGGCGFRSVADLKDGRAADRFSRYLRGRLGKTRKDGGASAQTATFLLAEARRFARWIARRGTGVPPDVFDPVAGFDPGNNREHARRDIQPAELDRVLEAARTSAAGHRGLSGEDRYHLYLTAFATGFRKSELAALAPANFHLEDDPPAVSLPGKVAKNRRGVRPPLPPGVAVALRAYLAGRPADSPVWPGKWVGNSAAMLRRDLAAAGVPYRVETPAGPAFADFHALRHTFCSALAASGAGVKELQALARHSDPRLTLGLYTHARSAELVKAVGRLRVPGAEASPLAHLNRDQLEALALGLAVLLGGALGVRPAAPPAGLVAPRVAPAAGVSGDFGERLDTKRRRRP